jgi:hypothetical protein
MHAYLPVYITITGPTNHLVCPAGGKWYWLVTGIDITVTRLSDEGVSRVLN